MYGGVSEMMRNRRYYYRSSVGKDYSHWTEEGKLVVQRFLQDMTQYIYDAEQDELDKRAKDMVLAELKK